MPRERISLTITLEALQEVDARAEDRERSATVSRDLERYYYLLGDERRRLRDSLTSQEVGLILDLCNGTLFSEPFSIRALGHEVRDGIALDQLDKKWSVDPDALLQKIEALSYASLVALIDAVERWWNRVGQGEHSLSPDEALKG